MLTTDPGQGSKVPAVDEKELYAKIKSLFAMTYFNSKAFHDLKYVDALATTMRQYEMTETNLVLDQALALLLQKCIETRANHALKVFLEALPSSPNWSELSSIAIQYRDYNALKLLLFHPDYEPQSDIIHSACISWAKEAADLALDVRYRKDVIGAYPLAVQCNHFSAQPLFTLNNARNALSSYLAYGVNRFPKSSPECLGNTVQGGLLHIGFQNQSDKVKSSSCTSISPSNLPRIPDDIICCISEYLPIRSIIQLRQTCKALAYSSLLLNSAHCTEMLERILKNVFLPGFVQSGISKYVKYLCAQNHAHLHFISADLLDSVTMLRSRPRDISVFQVDLIADELSPSVLIDLILLTMNEHAGLGFPHEIVMAALKSLSPSEYANRVHCPTFRRFVGQLQGHTDLYVSLNSSFLAFAIALTLDDMSFVYENCHGSASPPKLGKEQYIHLATIALYCNEIHSSQGAKFIHDMLSYSRTGSSCDCEWVQILPHALACQSSSAVDAILTVFPESSILRVWDRFHETVWDGVLHVRLASAVAKRDGKRIPRVAQQWRLIVAHFNMEYTGGCDISLADYD